MHLLSDLNSSCRGLDRHCEAKSFWIRRHIFGCVSKVERTLRPLRRAIEPVLLNRLNDEVYAERSVQAVVLKR